MRDVQLGNRNVVALSWKKGLRWPEGRRSQRREPLAMDREGTSLAPPISVALETEVSIVQDRSPTETAADRCPKRC